jgi:hypothetical protein
VRRRGRREGENSVVDITRILLSGWFHEARRTPFQTNRLQSFRYPAPGVHRLGRKAARFRPLPQAVYFDCDSVYIRMEAVATSGTMQSQSVTRSLEIHNEEEMMAAVRKHV